MIRMGSGLAIGIFFRPGIDNRDGILYNPLV